ncbi:MAG: hypothetical protein K2Y27_31785 [Xanthobacteraceae bacterium]|nr:hypothetical protein [Xanthobacteraceae bacterium]
MPTKEEFARAIGARLRDAELRGADNLDLNSGQLHRDLGGYPGPGHQMPSCCDALYSVQRAGDTILTRPPKGKGASLTIRYKLPR